MIGNVLQWIGDRFFEKESECWLKASFETIQPIEGTCLYPRIEMEREEPVEYRWFRYDGSNHENDDSIDQLVEKVKLEMESSSDSSSDPSSDYSSDIKRDSSKSSYSDVEECLSKLISRRVEFPQFTLVSMGSSYTPKKTDVGKKILFSAKVKLSNESKNSHCVLLLKEVLSKPITPIPLPTSTTKKREILPESSRKCVSISSLNLMGFMYPKKALKKDTEEEITINSTNPEDYYIRNETLSRLEWKELFNFRRRRLSIFEEMRSRNCDIFCLNHIHPEEIEFYKKRMFEIGYESSKPLENIIHLDSFIVSRDLGKKNRSTFSIIFYRINVFRFLESASLTIRELSYLVKKSVKLRNLSSSILEKRIQVIQLQKSRNDFFRGVNVDHGRIDNIMKEISINHIFFIVNVHFTPDEDQNLIETQLKLIHGLFNFHRSNELGQKIRRLRKKMMKKERKKKKKRETSTSTSSSSSSSSEIEEEEEEERRFSETDLSSFHSDDTSSSELSSISYERTKKIEEEEVEGESDDDDDDDEEEEEEGLFISKNRKSSRKKEKQNIIIPFIIGCGGHEIYISPTLRQDTIHEVMGMTTSPFDDIIPTTQNNSDGMANLTYIKDRKISTVPEKARCVVRRTLRGGGVRFDGSSAQQLWIVDTFILFKSNMSQTFSVDSVSLINDIHSTKFCDDDDEDDDFDEHSLEGRGLDGDDNNDNNNTLRVFRNAKNAGRVVKRGGKAKYPNRFYVSESPGKQIQFCLYRRKLKGNGSK